MFGVAVFISSNIQFESEHLPSFCGVEGFCFCEMMETYNPINPIENSS